MRRAELLEILACGENSGIEFKRDDVRPEQMAREIVAMANLKGGRLLLGVEDDGTVSGLQREDTEEWVMNIFATKIHPILFPFYEEVALKDGRRVAVVTISEGAGKPYVLRHEGREDIYIRLGSTSRLATREQQARLYEVGGMLHAELLPVSGVDLASLDRQRLSHYLEHVTRDDRLPGSEQAWCERLVALGFMTHGPAGVPVATVAGLLLFAPGPRHFLRCAGLRVMVFDEDDKAYDARYDNVVDGPLLALWSNRAGDRARVADGLLETVDGILQPYITTESGEVGPGFRRSKNPRFSREVTREVLLNAFAHRDWTRFADIELVIYSDRMEVTSPGALPNTMTVEKMIAGQRSPRNPLLVDILRDYGYVDARGMGVRNKIIPLVRAATGRDPVFEATDDCLKTVIPASVSPTIV